MEEYSRARHVAGGYEFVYTPHITKADLFESLRSLAVVRRGHVSADGVGRRPEVLLEADELSRFTP
jgi:threonyl-tRNA synthetase